LDRNNWLGFFAGILPELSKQEIIARNLVSPGTTFALL
jgi:hypothetical protein